MRLAEMDFSPIKEYTVMKNLENREQLDVKALKERIDEMLRLVKEKGEIIEVTEKGKVIARLVPTNEPENDEVEMHHKKDIKQWLANMDQLAQEIGKHWPHGVSAVEAVQDIRRDL
jgi:antitoxin (DNA-binding transcriptional repressor) of toxin-antitoxin stability system